MNTEEPKYQDYTDFTPEKLKFLTMEQEKLTEDHLIIIQNLRKKEMTAKEIHDLYIKTNENGVKKHEKSLKTIYRYLEILRHAKIVTIIGHRIKKGSRVAEKLYGRTAKVFIRKSAVSGMCEEENNEYADILTKFIYTRFGVENPDISSFKQFFLDFFRFLTEEFPDVFTAMSSNEEITEYITSNDTQKGNYVLDLTATLGTLIRHPELLEQLSNLIA